MILSSSRYLHSSALRGENGRPASAQNCACSDSRKASISFEQVNSLNVSKAVLPQLIRSPSLISSSSWHCRLYRASNLVAIKSPCQV